MLSNSNWTPSILVLNTLITNKIVMTNAETLVHNFDDPVRHTTKKSWIGSLEINSSCKKTFEISDSAMILSGNNNANMPQKWWSTGYLVLKVTQPSLKDRYCYSMYTTSWRALSLLYAATKYACSVSMFLISYGLKISASSRWTCLRTVEPSHEYSVPYRIPEGDTIKTTIYDQEISYGQTVKPT